MSRAVSLTIFLSIFIAVVALGHSYLWLRWVRDTHLPNPWNRIVTALIALLGLTVVAAPIVYRLARGTDLLVVPAYLWFGTAFYAVLLLFLGDLARLFVSLGSSLSEVPTHPQRRLMIVRALSGSAALVSVLLTATAVRGAVEIPGVKRVKIAIKGLPKSFRGMRIVQLSDIHVGPTIGGAFVAGVVEQVNALKPDLIAITGDLVDGSVEELGAAVSQLKKLAAPFGVFFSTGNHEYYSGVEQWLNFLPKLGIDVLRNRHTRLRRGDESIVLAGVDDHTAAGFGHGHGANYQAALGGIDPAETVILLAHQPRQIAQATRVGVDLVLSGHTHGGQLWPFGGLVRLAQPYLAGLHRHDERAQIYVSRGTGYWGPPMRLGAPAEITEITLIE